MLSKANAALALRPRSRSKLPDYGRELVECDACKTWFHPTCAGTTLEVRWARCLHSRPGVSKGAGAVWWVLAG